MAIKIRFCGHVHQPIVPGAGRKLEEKDRHSFVVRTRPLPSGPLRWQYSVQNPLTEESILDAAIKVLGIRGNKILLANACREPNDGDWATVKELMKYLKKGGEIAYDEPCWQCVHSSGLISPSAERVKEVAVAQLVK